MGFYSYNIFDDDDAALVDCIEFAAEDTRFGEAYLLWDPDKNEFVNV